MPNDEDSVAVLFVVASTFMRRLSLRWACVSHTTTYAQPASSSSTCSSTMRTSMRLGSSNNINVNASDLRRALSLLSLPHDATDADIKRAFQRYAKEHHPDLTNTNSNNDESSTRIIAGTEAYQLLRRTPLEVRQRVLREEHHASHTYTEEEYAKAQRAYHGSPRRGRRSSDGGDDAHDAFDVRTSAGRVKTAQYNQYLRKVEALRRHVGRDAPPWRVDDLHARSSSSSPHSRRSVHGLGFQWMHNLNASWTELRHLREERRRNPGFAGMDGSRYDDANNTARVSEELHAQPSLRQYILMRQRARDRAALDRAMHSPLMLFMVVLAVVSVLLMVVAAWRKYRGNAAYAAMQRARAEEIAKGL